MLPIIKWTGSKRFQAPKIVSNFPKEIDTYYEPFIGGGSVLGEYLTLLEGGSYTCKKIICSDTNIDLINIWKLIKTQPDYFLDEYSLLYNEFSNLEIDDKKKFYNDIKNKYNEYRRNNIDTPQRYIYFNWLLRNCFNGLVRYNKYGDFNTSCHFTRNGIKPEKLELIINEWSILLNKYNVNFECKSYKDFNNFNENDLVYCDPPYENSKGMYDFDKFDNLEFFDWLRNIKCKYLLSYDGISGKYNNTFDMPTDLYDSHEYILSSQSSFKRLVKSEYVDVYDSLYIKEAKK